MPSTANFNGLNGHKSTEARFEIVQACHELGSRERMATIDVFLVRTTYRNSRAIEAGHSGRAYRSVNQKVLQRQIERRHGNTKDGIVGRRRFCPWNVTDGNVAVRPVCTQYAFKLEISLNICNEMTCEINLTKSN